MKIGSLFSGYGGLDMGVQAVLGGEVVWHSDIDKGSCKLLAHRHPGVLNLGDISAVDWTQVEPVDVLTGGFPCQDVSAAGKRAGIRPGTRSGLWTQFAYAISQLRPRLVVIENVRGLLSAKAHSDVEPCAWCVGDDADGALRALGAVLGDLAGLGYDAVWHGLRAADVGAPHGRFRVFVVAYPYGEGRGSLGRLDPIGRDAHGRDRADGPRATSEPATLLSTPRSDTNGAGQRGSSGDLMLSSAVHHMNSEGAGHHRPCDPPRASDRERGSAPAPSALLPTPAVNDMGEGKTVEAWDAWTARMKDAHGNGNGHGASLAIEAQRLPPTPEASRAGGTPERHMERKREADGRKNTSVSNLDILAGATSTDWGDYAPAIHRWETLTRPAPPPTMTSTKGNPQLAPPFVEWMMGLPAGWITDVPGLTRNDMLKLCGNGVVPQQAEAALRILLAREAVAAA